MASTNSEGEDPIARAPLPAVLFFICLLGGWAIGVAVPGSLPLSFHWQIAAGSTVLLGAFVLALLTLREMARWKTPIDPNSMPMSLVTSGPFRISRNPLYLALAGTLAGIALLLASSWLLLAAAVLVALLDALVIPAEERMLAAKFSEQFQNYRMRVRRWI